MNPTHNTPSTAAVDSTPADVLRATARYIYSNGWHQGSPYGPITLPGAGLPPACIEGALHVTLCGHADADTRCDATPETWRQIHHTTRVLAGHLYDTVQPADPWVDGDTPNDAQIVTDWNDEYGRTAGEVIATLREAADEWDRSHTVGGAR
jgi:hypothetical protein